MMKTKPNKPPYILLKGVTFPHEKPEMGPSGGVPEEDIIIVGDGTAPCMSLPLETVGEDMGVEDRDADNPGSV